MARYEIPLTLEATPHGSELHVEVDLQLLADHAGCTVPLAWESLRAALPNGQPLPVQRESGRVSLALPAGLRSGASLTLTVAEDAARPAPPRVIFSQDRNAVELWIDSARWATYRYNTQDPELPRPYFHPILGPGGVPITQDGEFPGTKQGHIWHTGLVLAHQNFTGGNNWQTGSPNFSRMRHVAFDVLQSGPVLGRFTERLEWLNVKGDRVVFHEARTVTVPAREPARRCLDVDTVITCGDEPAVWNATPYHLLAIRVPEAMLIGKGGVLTNSEGGVNPKDGVPAAWLDYSGPLGGKVAGVVLMNHPANPRHPTPWLNFQNQTIGAAPTHREPYAWAPGESLRFRYRVYFHAGDVQQGCVAEEYAAYRTEPQVRIGVPRRLA